MSMNFNKFRFCIGIKICLNRYLILIVKVELVDLTARQYALMS
jgi:hypothetical protein